MINRTHANKTWLHGLVAPVFVMAWAMTGFGQQGGASEDTYLWHSELVELNPDSHTVTLKSRILSYAEVDDFASMSPGDRIAVTWSGASGRASGIRRVRADAGHEWNDPFTMPADFVSTEYDDRYLTFRLPVPPTAMEAIESLEPGEWVTVTSPQRPSGPGGVIVAARPYTSS